MPTAAKPPPTESRAKELRLLAASRTSSWFGMAFGGLSFTLGLAAIYVLVSGIRASRTLPTEFRPGVGPGFSEAATQAFGSMIVSALFAGTALVALAIALLHAKGRRAQMLLVGLPFFTYVVIFGAVMWLGTSWL